MGKTQFIMYSGLHTIGGVNAAVIYGKDRVIFEMGAAYDPKTEVFDGIVEKRNRNWLVDKLKLGSLPKIPGIFSKADLGDYPLLSAEESDYNTAIFITHLHLDHMAHINAVSPLVPIYMHKNAQIIEKALEVVGQGVDGVPRDYCDLVADEVIRVGEIEVYPILTNAESYCDFAFLITTPDGTIHWTGDLSLHGDNVALNFRQLEILKERNIDVLLCDCTSFMDDVMQMMYQTMDAKAIIPAVEIPKGMMSDSDYDAAVFEIVKGAKKLCVFNYYQREMAQAQRFIDWAKQLGRICIFEPDAAYIIHKFFGIKPNVYIPDVAVYNSENKLTWYRKILDNCNVVKLQEIKEKPESYLLQNSYPHILELFSLPSEEAVYVHADGIPIGEFDPAYQKMLNLVEKSGFKYATFFQKNYFGHGYPCQVKYFVDEVNPKVLIPCHSFNPERLLPKDGVQLLPELYKTYVLVDHNLVLEADL